MSTPFVAYKPTTEDYWRGIILFGRNVATYKFALAQSLLELRPQAGQLVRLEDLAVPFSSSLCAHLRLAQRQGTSPGSRFLDACRRANLGELTATQLIDETVRLGFKDVIGAFHVLGRDEIQQPFFLDERKSSGGIRITEAFSRLLAGVQAQNLPSEADARWRLVETAWEVGVTPALLAVSHDPATESLFLIDDQRRRQSITGARAALSGYQKGHCFHCFDSIAVLGSSPPDVDHFFPHSLKSTGTFASLDGVWNLVLACRRCNRGAQGKFNHVPSIRLLERLHARNEFLIASNHPLKETLMAQTGSTEPDRRSFLNGIHAAAKARLIHEWHPQEVQQPLF